MGEPQMQKEDVVQCECGRTWQFYSVKLTRDIETFDCEYGKTLKSWSGARTYTAEEIAADDSN